MLGKIVNISVEKNVEVKKDGVKYKKGDLVNFVRVKVECVNDNGEVKIYKGTIGFDYFKDYLQYCGVKSKELMGKEVNVVTKRVRYTDPVTKEYIYSNEVKFLNVLNEEGKPILMPSKDSNLSLLDI